VIPHQMLHYVPFAALTDGKRYLTDEHELFLLPSASILRYIQENASQKSRQSAVVFGNPASVDTSSLPSAAKESKAIASLLDVTPFIDKAATEQRLRESTPGAGIVHLAAHGTYSVTNPLSGAVYLAPSGEDDGLLEVRESYGLDLSANQLVVLSACETQINDLSAQMDDESTGQLQLPVSAGDEVVSLTRALFFAGAPTVIASLWSVEDEATQTLMVAFYRHWLQGMGKAEALQAAQAEVRSEPLWVSPFYWAGYVLNGDPQ
jgi:CHAT domain-containing protein